MIKSVNSREGTSGKKISIKEKNFEDTEGRVIIITKGKEYNSKIISWSNTQITAKLTWGVYPAGKCRIFIEDYQSTRTKNAKNTFLPKSKTPIGREISRCATGTKTGRILSLETTAHILTKFLIRDLTEFTLISLMPLNILNRCKRSHIQAYDFPSSVV